jgi:hypothetical protein
MYAHVTLIWLYHGKIESESVVWYDGARRAKQLQGCMATKVYRLTAILGTLQLYTGNRWLTVEDAPEEIKLAAMLL